MAEKSVREWISSLCEEAADSPLLDNFMEMAGALFSSKLRAGMRNYGIALGTLHLMQPHLDNSSNVGSIAVAGVEVPISGGISNLKEGDLSISFSASGDKIEESSIAKVSLARTRWGIQLWELISSNAIFMCVASGRAA